MGAKVSCEKNTQDSRHKHHRRHVFKCEIFRVQRSGIKTKTASECINTRIRRHQLETRDKGMKWGTKKITCRA